MLQTELIISVISEGLGTERNAKISTNERKRSADATTVQHGHRRHHARPENHIHIKNE